MVHQTLSKRPENAEMAIVSMPKRSWFRDPVSHVVKSVQDQPIEQQTTMEVTNLKGVIDVRKACSPPNKLPDLP